MRSVRSDALIQEIRYDSGRWRFWFLNTPFQLIERRETERERATIDGQHIQALDNFIPHAPPNLKVVFFWFFQGLRRVDKRNQTPQHDMSCARLTLKCGDWGVMPMFLSGFEYFVHVLYVILSRWMTSDFQHRKNNMLNVTKSTLDEANLTDSWIARGRKGNSRGSYPTKLKEFSTTPMWCFRVGLFLWTLVKFS